MYSPKPEIKLAPFVFVGLGTQLLVIYAGFGEAELLRRFLLVISYLLLLPFVWANRQRIGILIIGIGLFLNFLAVVANGGLMPVSPATLERAGLQQRIVGVEVGEPVPLSKDVLLERADTRLWLLTDVLVWDNPANVRAFSVGDAIIGAGLLLTLADLLLPRLRRISEAPANDATRCDSG